MSTIAVVLVIVILVALLSALPIILCVFAGITCASVRKIAKQIEKSNSVNSEYTNRPF